MRYIKLSITLLFMAFWGLVSCQKGDSATPVNPDEQLLISVSWKPEGIYVNSIKQPTTPPFTLRFFPEVAGIRAVVINGIPGGTWRLNSAVTPKQLTINYPSATFNIENGNPVGTGSVTFDITTLSSTNFNLSASSQSSFYGIITLSADTELRMTPQP